MMQSKQQWLEENIGKCKKCLHPLKRVVSVHVSETYPSGLTLMDSHWNITEVDYGEATGVGCTFCESYDYGEYCAERR